MSASAVAHSEAVLRKALLTAGELPRGWTVRAASSGMPLSGDCPQLDALAGVPGSTRAAIGYVAPGGAVISAEIDAMTPEQATVVLSRVSTALTCGSFLVYDGGTWDQVTLSPLTFPVFGDRTVAERVTVAGNGRNSSFDLVLIQRRGVVLSFVNRPATGSPDTGLTSLVAGRGLVKADARLS